MITTSLEKDLKEGMLLFVYKNQRAFNNQKMKILFNGNVLINTGSHMLINKREYTLEDIFGKIRDLNVGQFILSCEKYSMIIRYCILNNIDIVEINHYEDMDRETLNYIEELLNELNRTDISLRLQDTLLRSLLYELKYLSNEQDIDISSMVIKTQNNNKITFFNNNKISFNETDIDLVRDIVLLFQEQ